MRRCLRMGVLAAAASVAGCHLPSLRINDLAASVEGPVGEADLRPIAGERYSSFAWGRYASTQRQLLRVRLSTSRDMAQFAGRKGARIQVRWNFCGEPKLIVVGLGGWDAYVGGAQVPVHGGPSPTVTDERGRFAYDAVLYPRDPRSAKDRWFPSGKYYEEAYDLEREPRDVCVRVVFSRMFSAYRTNVVTIPKEAIAAALGVPAGGTIAPVSEERAGEALILCADAYERAKGRPLPDDIDRAHVVVVEDAAEVWFARNPLGRLRRLGSRPADEAVDPICGMVFRPALRVASVRERSEAPSQEEEVLFETSDALRSHVDRKLDGYPPGSRGAAEGGSSAMEMLFLREGAGFEFDGKMRWSEAEEIRHGNELAWREKERRELAKRAKAWGSGDAVRFCASEYERLAGRPLPDEVAKAHLHVNDRTGAMVVLFVTQRSSWTGAASGQGVLARCRILGGRALTIRHMSDRSRVLLGEPEGSVEDFGDICISYLKPESEFIIPHVNPCEYYRRRRY